GAPSVQGDQPGLPSTPWESSIVQDRYLADGAHPDFCTDSDGSNPTPRDGCHPATTLLEMTYIGTNEAGVRSTVSRAMRESSVNKDKTGTPMLLERTQQPPLKPKDVKTERVETAPGTKCIFDVRVTDPSAKSYRKKDPRKVLETQEKEKKDKYLMKCLERRKHFTPLVFSVNGMAPGREAKKAMKHLASMLAEKWERPHAHGQISYTLETQWNVSRPGTTSSSSHCSVHSDQANKLWKNKLNDTRETPTPNGSQSEARNEADVEADVEAEVDRGRSPPTRSEVSRPKFPVLQSRPRTGQDAAAVRALPRTRFIAPSRHHRLNSARLP
ncbi:hypothetical protein THAOC_34067, partial [Thalassiosira oceanica]